MALLGSHILKEKGYAESIQEAVDQYGITAAQIFVGGPRSKKMVDIDVKALKSYIKKSKVSVYAHNAYFGAPWSGKSEQIEFVKEQLNRCAELGIEGFVIHLPKKPLDVVIEVLPQLVHDKVEILLEIPSVKPDPNLTWETPERINALCKSIRKNKIRNVFICVDTSHIFACGYDISSKKQASGWLSKIKYPNMIHMIHLNDSAVPIGHGTDIHERLGEGYMWKNQTPKKSGMAPFIKFAHDYQIPIILERAGRLKNENIDREVDLLVKYFKKYLETNQ